MGEFRNKTNFPIGNSFLNTYKVSYSVLFNIRKFPLENLMYLRVFYKRVEIGYVWVTSHYNLNLHLPNYEFKKLVI